MTKANKSLSLDDALTAGGVVAAPVAPASPQEDFSNPATRAQREADERMRRENGQGLGDIYD